MSREQFSVPQPELCEPESIDPGSEIQCRGLFIATWECPKTGRRDGTEEGPFLSVSRGRGGLLEEPEYR